MLRVTGDMLDIEILRRVLRWVVVFWERHVPLLSDWEAIDMERYDRRFIARKRRRCTLNGHIWELSEMRPSRNEYVIECSRCFPHIDSRRVIVSYNPFPTVERKTD